MRMKESYKEQLAIDFGHKPYAGSGDALGVAYPPTPKATGGQVGAWRRRPAIELRHQNSRVPTVTAQPCPDKGKATSSLPPRQGEDGHGGVVEPVHVSKFQAREPGSPAGIRSEPPRWSGFKTDRWFNVSDGNPGKEIGDWKIRY